MQTTLLDFVDSASNEKILARVITKVKMAYGSRIVVNRIVVCRNCRKNGMLEAILKPKSKRRQNKHIANIRDPQRELKIGFRIRDGRIIIYSPVEFFWRIL